MSLGELSGLQSLVKRKLGEMAPLEGSEDLDDPQSLVSAGKDADLLESAMEELRSMMVLG